MNSWGVILGWACGLGRAQDLLLMLFLGSGSWVLSGPPGKLQACHVRNQINTPGGSSKENSGFQEPPHPAWPNCHLSLPWHGGLFFGSQAPINRMGLQGTQGDADLGDQPVVTSGCWLTPCACVHWIAPQHCRRESSTVDSGLLATWNRKLRALRPCSGSVEDGD